MSRQDWLKVIILILIPMNTWLGVFYYLHWHWQKAKQEAQNQMFRDEAARVRYFQNRLGIKEGQRLHYPFPYPVSPIGNPPPVGQGYPVLFININWIPIPELWQPVISEALKASHYLHVVLICRRHPAQSEEQVMENVKEFLRPHNSPRLSVLLGGDWVYGVFGGQMGILLILCDGQGIVRHVEPYPQLEFSRDWQVEVADWRPKLHQAVKKVLDKFFPKEQGR